MEAQVSHVWGFECAGQVSMSTDQHMFDRRCNTQKCERNQFHCSNVDLLYKKMLHHIAACLILLVNMWMAQGISRWKLHAPNACLRQATWVEAASHLQSTQGSSVVF